MPTNGHNLEEQVASPSNGLVMRPTGENNNNNHNNNNNNNQEFNVWDHLFYQATLGYARIFPRSLRRIIELIFLLKAVLSFLVLVYVHMYFSFMPANCLDHVKDVWPRNGILRVEIIQSFQRSHAEQTGTINTFLTVEKSYECEHKLKSMYMSEENATFFNRFNKTNSLKNKGMDIEPSSEELVENKFQDNETLKPNLFNYLSFINYINIEAIFYSNYIIEYSLEYGLLHLSPSARNRSSIPVMLVSLEPSRNKCYGNSVGQFFLEYFLGYNDLLLSSVKSLAENEQNKGFMRNVITGEYYIFENIPMARTLYIISFFIMVLFTLLISMLNRYLHHQMFVFVVSLQQLLNVHSSLSFPAAALLSVLLALVGIGAIMSELFNDRTTAVYVILIVWLADQYDTMCSRCPITKRHWLKFFYLYHLSFYAYHFRFNGQYSNLALICSWFFIQHSMIYFYHHYEVLHVLQRAQSE